MAILDLTGPLHGHKVDPERGVIIGVRGRPIGSRDSGGHIQIDLRMRGGTLHLAHRIIWQAVHGEIPAGMIINHINGNPADNRIANLECISQRENLLHAYRIGLKSNAGEKHPNNKLSSDQVALIRFLHDKGAPKKVLAAHFSVSRKTISDVVIGKTWRVA